MAWRELFARKGGLDEIERHVLEMLDFDRETLDMATRGLFGAADPESLRQQVSDSDHRVNLLVQQVRRQLVVHASVHGAGAEVGAMFATMSIVKDIERIGDYAKRLLRVARVHGPLERASNEQVLLADYCDRITGYLTAVRDALAEQDRDRAMVLITDTREMADEIDGMIERLLVADPAPPDAVAVALACHFLARIVAHLGNVVTSIVAPVDLLDFYDEPQDNPAGADS